MMKKSKYFLAALLIPILFAYSDALLADEQISPRVRQTLLQSSPGVDSWIGLGEGHTWQLHPGFEFHTVYHSNVNREPGRSRDEEIALQYIPSAELSRQGTRLGVRAEYEMNFEQFLRDENLNAFNHTADGNLKFTGERLTIDLGDEFQLVKRYATSEQSERRTIERNNFAPQLAYRLTPKVSVSAWYRNYFFRYPESILEQYSYWSHTYASRFSYHWTPKLDAFVEGSGTTVDYYNSDLFDSLGFTAVGGLMGRMTNKLVLDIKAGFRGRKYDFSTVNSYKNWIIEGGVRYVLTPKTTATLIGKRDLQESVFRTTAWYAVNRAELDLNYRLTPRINTSIGGVFQRNGYPREALEVDLFKKRRDYIYGLTTRLEWKPVRHLAIAFAYDFGRRSSNFDNAFDYMTHVAKSSVSCQF